MKAITLWQPYASFMAIGLKQNETRSWATKFRGELAICAAKRKPELYSDGICTLAWENKHRINPEWKESEPMSKLFPLGVIMCVVEVYDCLSVAQIESRNRSGQDDQIFISDDESMLGDYSAGRFAWLTRNVRRLKEPVPVSGKQGFFNLTQDIEKKVRMQL